MFRLEVSKLTTSIFRQLRNFDISGAEMGVHPREAARNKESSAFPVETTGVQELKASQNAPIDIGVATRVARLHPQRQEPCANGVTGVRR